MYKVWQNSDGLYLTVIPYPAVGGTRYDFNTTSLLQEAYVARNIPLSVLGHDNDACLRTFNPIPIKISI